VFECFCGDDDDDDDDGFAQLPDKCGGCQMIHKSCLTKHITIAISDGEIVPWIKTPAPDNNQHIPAEIIIQLTTVEDQYKFAASLVCKLLQRNSNWVGCQNAKYHGKQCRFGFVVPGNPKVKIMVCEFCAHKQKVSKNPEDNDPEMMKMLENGTMRKCPKCKLLTMKDKGMCNVIQCGRCAIWWNWSSRATGTNSRELKNKARKDKNLWEPGELEYQQELERHDLEAFKALLKKNGIQTHTFIFHRQ
jgi:hypothetical protein